VVADLQTLLDRHALESKILAASFKSSQQAMAVLKLGINAITLPIDIAMQMIEHPAVAPAIQQFETDWRTVFDEKRAYES